MSILMSNHNQTRINNGPDQKRDPSLKGSRKRIWALNKIENKDGGNDAELLLYGPIENEVFWGDEVTPNAVAKELEALGNIKNLDIKINSPGGSIHAGQAIHNIISRNKAYKTAYIDFAASAATVVSLSADKIKMPKNSLYMLHEVWGIQIGTADDMEAYAALLRKVNSQIAKQYEDKTGKSNDEITKMMKAETWLTGSEALEHGFVDEIEEFNKVAASLNDKTLIVNGLEFDVSSFKNISKLNLFNQINQSESTEDNPKPENKGVNTDNTIITEEPQIMNLEELKTKHPELYNQILNDGKEQGVKAERERLKAIDEISSKGHEELVNKSKYAEPVSAEKLCFLMMAAEKKTRDGYLDNVKGDAAAVNNISAPDPNNQNIDQEKEKSFIENMVKGFQRGKK